MNNKLIEKSLNEDWLGGERSDKILIIVSIINWVFFEVQVKLWNNNSKFYLKDQLLLMKSKLTTRRAKKSGQFYLLQKLEIL